MNDLLSKINRLPEDIKKYKGKYDKGWDKVREERMERMLKMGIIDSKWKLSDRDKEVPAWENTDNKEWWAACMEVYAAMVDRNPVLESLRKQFHFNQCATRWPSNGLNFATTASTVA